MTKKLLLTGFGPFLGYHYNSSGAIAEDLNGKTIEGCKVVGVVLPVAHGKATLELKSNIEKHKPFAVVSLGLSGSAGCITLERMAINRFYFVGDNIIDEPLEADGPAAYFSTLRLELIRNMLEKNDIPVEYSFWPDTFVSNEVFYESMHIAGANDIKFAGFVHLPLIHTQVIENRKAHYMLKQRMPSLSYAEEEKAIRIVIRSCLE